MTKLLVAFRKFARAPFFKAPSLFSSVPSSKDHGSNFHSRTVRRDIIKVFYLPTDAQIIALKRILKFTLKQLQHVSVLSPSSGSVQFELAKVMFVKTVH